MRFNSVELKEFYDTPQGRMVQRVLRLHLRSLWPDVAGLRVLGIGYALPYLRSFSGAPSVAAALFPAPQGAVFWPTEGKGLSCMCDTAELPIETSSIDRILLIHAFEDAEAFNATLAECWRVLAGQGRLVLAVPNRTGLWARADSTPFGHGAPWSMGQLRHVLKENQFVMEKSARALFVPPTKSRLLLATAAAWEKPGRRFFEAFGGVNVVEASKQLYAALPVTSSATRRIPATVLPVSERSSVSPLQNRR
jgi:SAM-dependent methyltransferase